MNINWNQMIGDSPLWEIVACVSIVVVFYAISLAILYKKAKDDADRRLYPNPEQVRLASSKQIVYWAENLPFARSQHELDVLVLIVDRYLEICEPDQLKTAPEFKIKESVEQVDEPLIIEAHEQI